MASRTAIWSLGTDLLPMDLTVWVWHRKLRNSDQKIDENAVDAG